MPVRSMRSKEVVMKRLVSGAIAVCLVLALGLFTAVAAFAETSVRFPLLGFTPMPFDASPDLAEQDAVFDVVYETIRVHGNIITHHFDEGVPWQEALEGRSEYHPNVEANIANRLARRLPNQKVYLALTPFAFDRRNLAGNWGAESGEPRTGDWADRDFGDLEVLIAYYHFCRDMIRRFEPDYFNYAIEANRWADETDPDRFGDFWVFATWIYLGLKNEFPDLPVFLSVIVDNDEEFARQRPFTELLLVLSDYVAVSTYPYLQGLADGDPMNLPEDWFARLRDLAPGKPYAVAETGFLAEDLVWQLEQGSFTIPGSSQGQNLYLNLLLNDAVTAEAQFVVWFVPIDYDALWARISGNPEIDPIFAVWRDTGLIDGSFQPRLALFTWDIWLAYSRWLNGF